jgi:hypothetical protein
MQQDVPVKKIITSVIVVMLVLIAFGLRRNLIEYLPADELMVIQYPTGTLRACTEPGYYAPWFGTSTHYKRRDQFWFSEKSDQGKATDESIGVRFNDGGHAQISGSLSWEMPVNPADFVELHKKYGTQDNVEKQIVRVQTEKAVYMTGSLMSSKESAAEKRPELLYYLEDQIQNGVFRTQNKSITITDDTTSLTKTVVEANILKDNAGLPQRVEESLLKQYKVKAQGVAINKIKYDEKVETQIQQQQQAIMDIQTAIAESKKAEQRKLTAVAEGESKAATAKWEQETIKAKEVTRADQEKVVAQTKAEQDKSVAETLANQKLNVAKLDAQAAEMFKKAETLRGEGESARRKLVMEADGALEKKLEAFVSINNAYATALSNFKGNLVPSVVMAGGANGSQSSAADVIDLFKVKVAKDLALDASLPAQTKTVAPAPAPVTK